MCVSLGHIVLESNIKVLHALLMISDISIAKTDISVLTFLCEIGFLLCTLKAVLLKLKLCGSD